MNEELVPKLNIEEMSKIFASSLMMTPEEMQRAVVEPRTKLEGLLSAKLYLVIIRRDHKKALDELASVETELRQKIIDEVGGRKALASSESERRQQLSDMVRLLLESNHEELLVKALFMEAAVETAEVIVEHAKAVIKQDDATHRHILISRELDIQDQQIGLRLRELAAQEEEEEIPQ